MKHKQTPIEKRVMEQMNKRNDAPYTEREQLLMGDVARLAYIMAAGDFSKRVQVNAHELSFQLQSENVYCGD